MSIRFDRRNKRLHVGFRATDWSPVWMVLKERKNDEDGDEENVDGEYEFEFYQNSTGDKVRREPMAGEIIWHSHFDPKYCDSRFGSEKRRLHQRFMSDAHQYLSLNDPAQIRKWERELDNPRAARWQSWFDIAKKYQRRRHPELRQGGDNNDDSDDDDSAYDSDGDRPDGNGGSMGPPTFPRRPTSLGKRKAPVSSRRVPGSKRSKFGVNGSPTRPGDSYFQMSGGLGNQSTRSARSVSRSIFDGYDNHSDIYDPRPPEDIHETNNNMINAHDLDNLPSPVGPRHRGESREERMTPFNEWVHDGGPRDHPEGERNSLVEQDEDRRRMEAYNGNMDPDTAERLARDQSERPEPSINGDFHDEEAYQAAIQASLSSHSPSPRPSIET